MLFLFPPTTRVVPSVPPVGRLLVSPLPPSPGFASLRSVVRGLCRLPSSLRSLAARRRRNPAAGRWTLPAASHPRLRFGHPARPPKALLRCSFLCTFSVCDAYFFVSLCLAAVGFASAFADAFAFESVLCSLGCAAEFVPRLRIWIRMGLVPRLVA